MITIKNFCIGNKEKSYFIDKFTNGVNIIHSDDNNKGKTIVSQGIMFALGNTPSFPSGFETYKDYYYFVTLVKNEQEILICRKNDCFIVNDGVIRSYDSVNEFKRFFNEKIFSLPFINKNGITQLSGLELLIEMIFLPQDDRTTFNIVNRGRYTKEDYYDFIYSYMKCSKFIDPDTILKYKQEISELEEKRKVLKKSSSLLKAKNVSASFITYTAAKTRIDEKLKKVEKAKEIISSLITTKNRQLNKITKNELLLNEINSLNRDLEQGRLICSDCGSERISYESKKSSVIFDITDSDTRKQIKEILSTRIQILYEDIQDIDDKLVQKKLELAELMKDEEVSMENLLFYKNSIIESSSFDQEIYNLDNRIAMLKKKIEDANKQTLEETRSKEIVHLNFVKFMEEFYHYVEPNDNLTVNELFTKKGINYSGSQGALFLMARIYAASKLMELKLPIYIDDFRDGELSSEKEEKVIEKFKELNKQVILTCTLKNEEKNKYSHLQYINEISFDDIVKFNLLQTKYNDIFLKFLKKLSIDIELQK